MELVGPMVTMTINSTNVFAILDGTEPAVKRLYTNNKVGVCFLQTQVFKAAFIFCFQLKIHIPTKLKKCALQL